MRGTRLLRRCAPLALLIVVVAVLRGPAASGADSVDPQWPIDSRGDGCSAPVWPSDVADESRRVLVVGDSLIRDSRTMLERQLEREGWAPTVRCWGAKGTDWGLQQIQRARQLKQLPETVVVSLGTNDIWWLHIPLDYGIDQMMAAIGPKRTVYWVNLWFGPNGYDDLPSPARANSILRAKAKVYPNLKIINFASAFKAAEQRRSDVGWADGVHLNEAGYRVRTKAIVEALRAQIPQPEPSPGPTPAPTPSPSASPSPQP